MDSVEDCAEREVVLWNNLRRREADLGGLFQAIEWDVKDRTLAREKLPDTILFCKVRQKFGKQVQRRVFCRFDLEMVVS
jgi:hypothetical protein